MLDPMFRSSRLASGFLILTLLLAAREVWLHPRGRFVAHFLDVGQGDSALLLSPSGKQILIDGGPDFSTLEGLGATMPFLDRSIDLLVLTHPQRDHMRAFPEVLRRYAIGGVLMTGVLSELPEYQAFLELLKERSIPLHLADPAKDIDLGDGLVLDIAWPPPTLFGVEVEGDRVKRPVGRHAAFTGLNDTSIVLRAMYDHHGILFTGDIEERAERMILATGAAVSADVLKVPHHGSRTSSSTGFLLAVHPELAIISTGRGNRYGHPHHEVTDRYRHLGIPVRLTAEEGRVTIQFPLPGKENR